MQHLFISVLLSVFFVSTAFADWLDDFDANLEKDGIEVAVKKSLEVEKTPNDILSKSLKEGINPQIVLKILYCESLPGDDIKTAAFDNEISKKILHSAFEKSVAECGGRVAVDSRAYTMEREQRVSFPGSPSPVNLNTRTVQSISSNTFN